MVAKREEVMLARMVATLDEAERAKLRAVVVGEATKAEEE